MKKFLTIVFCAILLLAGEHGASAQLSRLHFGSYKINRISLLSLRSVNGEAQAVCTNDSLAFTMSNISGVVYKNGRPFVHGTANPVSVASGTSTVVVKGTATLYDDVTLWDVLSCIAFRPSDYTIDVSMRITNSAGASRSYSRNGISVANLLHNIRGK